MAFPVVQSSGLGNRTSNGGFGATVSIVSMPSGVAVGDLLVAVSAGSSITPTPPATGWTTLHSGGNGTAVYWKIADSGDLTSTQNWVAMLGNSNSESCEIGIARITGHDPVTPINTSHFTDSASNITALTDSGITPTTQCLLLMISAALNGSGTMTVSGQQIASNNPSWTEQIDANSEGSAGTNDSQVSLAYANQSAAGGVATGADTMTASRTVNPSLTGIIAIQPPVTVTVPILSVGSSALAPSFTLGVSGALLSLTTTLFVATMSEIKNKWLNVAKIISSWTNTPKS